MRVSSIILVFATLSNILAQETPNDFCSADASKTYFPLDIKVKQVVWGKIGYIETRNREVLLDDKMYYSYVQSWSIGEIDTIYLREIDGVIMQYDKLTNSEFKRYDPAFKKGHLWEGGCHFVTFKVKSFKGKLTTPHCSYKNLMVIKGKYDTGDSYKFYYLKGYGYVGTTNSKGLISFIAPKK